MKTSHALLIAGVLAACGGGSKPPPTPPTPAPAPATAAAPMTWLEGTYGGDAGGAGTGTLHVHASEGALYAVWLGNEQARVWIFDEEGEVLQAWSYVGIGAAPAESVFKIMSEGEKVAAFGDPSRLLTLRRAPSGAVVLSEAGTPSPFVTSELAPIAAAPAAIFEDADRAFAADSQVRGAHAWAASVAPGGVLFRRGAAIVGPDAVKETIAKTLAAIDLRWEPIASGMSASGTFGFTVGKATWTSRSDDSRGKGSYVTIWAVRPDGSARWIFDTGR